MGAPRLSRHAARLAALAGGLGLALLPALARQPATTRHRDDFSGPGPVWVRGETTGRFAERQHALTNDQAFTAPPSETVRFEVEPGGGADYSYTIPPAPAGEEFSARVFVKAEGANVQLLARLVLPRERDPQRLDRPLTTLIEGDHYVFAGRWQPLEMSRAWSAVKQQRQLLRAGLGRDISLEGAYFDQLILRLSGSGPGQVWADDLEVGPVLDTRGPTPVPAGPGAPQPSAVPRPTVEINRGLLLVGGQPFFPRGVRYCGADWGLLREAGFNTVWFEPSAAPQQIDQAAGKGFFVVPTLGYRLGQRGSSGNPFSVTAETADADEAELQRLGQEVGRFPAADAVLFWSLGGGHALEQVPQLARAAEAVRQADPQRPITADVWDGLKPYSRNLDLLGVHRWPLYTSLDLLSFRDWLDQRRHLAWEGSFMWTWVQAHRPDWYTKLLNDPPPPPGIVEPVGPQPEQVRLLTYVSLASGCRGLGFWADGNLGDPRDGQATFLTLALLNQELQMLEPILLSLRDEPAWIATSDPRVRAVVLRGDRGILVIPMWMGDGAQYVPGQAALAQLKILVPQVPLSMQAWEVSPGAVRSFPVERITGGVQVTLTDFDLTRTIVFTNDTRPNGLIARWEDQSRQMAQKAAYLSYQLALKQLQQVETVERQLNPVAPVLRGSEDLVRDCRERLDRARRAYEGQDFRAAYAEAQHATRPLRHLMRLRWEQAVGTAKQKALDLPAASPYALSYYTLPRHWLLAREVQNATAGRNVLEDGRFEGAATWMAQQTTIDDMVLDARLVEEAPQEGKRCLKLSVKPKPAPPGQQVVLPAVLERTYLAASSPAVHLPPGTLVRISGWVKVLNPVQSSVDGALFYDSAGGESLAVRRILPTKDPDVPNKDPEWQQFHLYRRVPASGSLFVTAALTGIGTVYFDDIRIEPLQPRQ
jgi:hypothetical protein